MCENQQNIAVVQLFNPKEFKSQRLLIPTVTIVNQQNIAFHHDLDSNHTVASNRENSSILEKQGLYCV